MDFLPMIIAIALCLIPLFFYFKLSTPRTKTNDARLPEPPGAWPIIGHLHLLGGQAPVAHTLGAMADKHGPIFSLRLGSHRALVVSSREAIKQCFTTNDPVFPTRPCMAVGKYIGYGNAAFALAPYGAYWRDVRKMATVELLTARRLEQLSHVRADEVRRFVKDMYAMSSRKEAVGMSGCFEHLTFNISTRMLAGKRFSFCNTGDDKDWQFKEAIKKALYLSGVFVYSDAIPSLEWLDIGGYIGAMKDTAEDIDRVLEGWVQERIQTRKKGSTSESDFMDVMLSSMEENEIISGYTRETVIKATIMILILTGSESTAETLIWALSLLLNNPKSLEKAQYELESIVGRSRWVQESDISGLIYLQAILKETLRLYPPGPLAGPREALQDCHVSKYFIPKGTRLIVNLWKLHRDPNVWPDPEKFRPERFLDESSHVNFKGQCFEYIPFSSGRRMCPGMTFGMQVIQLTLARLLQGFDVTTQMGEAVDMGEGLGIALPKVKPLEVVLTPRLPPELYENL